MALSLAQVSSLINKLAPKGLAADWDNVGLQVGSYKQEVEKILVALDVNEEVMSEAIENDVDLILSHHPFIFSDLSAIKFDTAVGVLIQKAVKNDIAIYSAHTNYDIAPEGLNDFLADKLGVKDTTPLQVTEVQTLKKLVVFVPEDALEKVREGLGEAGAGYIGDYSYTSFYQSGTGSFKPLAGSNPYQGEKEELNQVTEYRLETIVEEEILTKVIDRLKEVHPYEEVAYDIYPVENRGTEFGLGRIGYLETEVNLSDYIELLKSELNLDRVEFVGNLTAEISKVALCSGSGADFIKTASAQGADLYITGDVKYHEAQLAEELDLNLIDAGHYGTEKIMRAGMTDYLAEKVTTDKLDLEIIKSKINTNPFQVK